MRCRFDNRTISAAQKAGERVELWDTVEPGLNLLVTPAGSATFYVRYRTPKGQRRFKLGTFGRLTIDQARRDAKQALAAAERGEDPQADRQRSRGGLSLGAAFDRFVDEPGKRGDRKPRTLELYRQLFAGHLGPALGSCKLDAIARRDVERVKVAIGKGVGPTVANRTLALLSAILESAQRWGELPQGANPCRGVTRFREQGRERFLRAEERAALWSALDHAAAAPRGRSDAYLAPGAIACVRLLALTGARLSEITTLTWPMVDLAAGCLRLPDSKTGRKTIPLAPQAVALLARMHETHDRGVPLVCPSERGTVLRNMGRVWTKIRERAEIDGARLHDLRHSAASDALNAGVPLAIVGAMLGHANPRTTARYAHVADEALRRGVEALGDAHERALREGAKVARLRPAGEPMPKQARQPKRRKRNAAT